MEISREGHKYIQKDNAYYLTVQKDWQRFGFAGEIFKMGKFYRPHMNYYFPIIIYDPGYGRLPGFRTRNEFIRMSLIEDNDDNDQYPDKMTSMKYFISPTFNDINGVFPGNDLDNDSIPDNDKNYNFTPDYNEPFLMLDVDPDEFVFGDDFNNNNMPDFRENDMKYDTPYDLDRRGHHLLLRYTPHENINIMLGSFKTRGIGSDNRTDDNYLKVNLDYDVLSIGKVYAEYRYEKIRDNISDLINIVGADVKEVTYSSTPWGAISYRDEMVYDEREYRNSKVNKLFIESRIRAIPSITLENHVKYERNSQSEGTMYDSTYQPGSVLNTLAMVNKLVYTKQFGNWTFSPGLKYRLYVKGRKESLDPMDHYAMRIPVVCMKYKISSDTKITFGMQGFRNFEMYYKDYIVDYNNYRKINYLFQIENICDYFGYTTWTGFGFQLEQVSFDKIRRKLEEYKSSSFFMKICIGY